MAQLSDPYADLPSRRSRDEESKTTSGTVPVFIQSSTGAHNVIGKVTASGTRLVIDLKTQDDAELITALASERLISFHVLYEAVRESS